MRYTGVAGRSVQQVLLAGRHGNTEVGQGISCRRRGQRKRDTGTYAGQRRQSEEEDSEWDELLHGARPSG